MIYLNNACDGEVKCTNAFTNFTSRPLPTRVFFEKIHGEPKPDGLAGVVE